MTRWCVCNTVVGKVLVVCSECLQLGRHAQFTAGNVVSTVV